MAEYIAHHGIKGQKWYVRRYQNEDGSLTPEGRIRYGHDLLRKSMTSNLDKFGKDKDHNVLYITGHPGSGKTTLADSMAKNDDAVIHLDSYARPNEKNPNVIKFYENNMNKAFDSHLDKVFPDWKEKVLNVSNRYEVENGNLRFKETYLKEVDKLRSAIDSFGQEQFKLGNRVFVEGAEIKDGWLSSLGYYLNKPLIVVGTSQKESLAREIARDRTRAGLEPHFKNEKKVLNDYMKMSHEYLSQMDKNLDAFTRRLTYEKGKRFVKDLFK